MKKIQIISGTYGHAVGETVMPVNAKSGPIEVEDAEADRLVKMRVAKYCTDTVGENGSAGVATGSKDTAKPEYNTGMKQAELLEIMKAAGIPFKAGMSKAKMVELLDVFYADEEEPDDLEDDDEDVDDVDDAEGPPDLGAEDPVQ